MTLKFNKEEINKIETDYNNIEVDKNLNNALDQMAEIYNQSIDLSKLAMKGFLLFSMKDAQKELQLTTLDVKNLSPHDQQKVFALSFEHLHKRLKFALKNQSDDQIELLNNAMKEAKTFLTKIRR
ncbi:MAG: hypothetical protein GF317_07160 [Candidatus Lokiarchaeota archaeon]|nr:hypothetical protein [Candidatus Lokiarchaeota archaeon]MBD3199487.1 hypothetical protein [Candidatus Lokiarchaeota archaeon]